MINQAPFDLVITKLRAGDQDAADEVFRRFVHRLIGLASRQFDARFRSKEDPEEIVLSVYKSFFRQDGSTPYDLADWDGLWALLAAITVRKCMKRRQFYKRARRDVGRELVPCPEPSMDEWQEAIDRGPTPEQGLVLAETLELLVGRLDESHRRIAEMYFADYPQAEIAEACLCSERTVRRVLAWIRERLKEIEAEARDF